MRWYAHDGGFWSYISEYNGTGSDDAGFAQCDILDDGRADTDESSLVYGDMPGEFHAGTDMYALVNDRLVFDNAASIANDGIVYFDMSANIYTLSNYDIFANFGVLGDGSGRVYGIYEIYAMRIDNSCELAADVIVADGDDRAADPAQGKGTEYAQVA